MRKASKLSILVLIALLGLLLASCASSETANYLENASGDYDLPASEPVGQSESSAHDESQTERQERIIVMVGSLSVESYHPAEVIDFVSQLADRYGGYIVDSSLEKGVDVLGDVSTQGAITIRVPADRLEDAVGAIEALDLTVLKKDISGTDVTAEYVDLQSQLRNLESAAEQLQQIMENATDTDAVLNVYKELTKVNEEAEVIRGKIQYYVDVSSMSALTVEVSQKVDLPEPTPTPTPQPWSLSPAFRESGEQLSRSFQYWLEDVVHFFVYVLPILILRAGPWLVVFYFLARWIIRKGKRKNTKNTEEADKTE
ncbi:DUF4349 domain-containing protein [bacterium]|nr:DUF4349 domain-containing protein [bacterium]MCB2179225.1 DUF4349 domain-containing protein [bacterium]